MPNAKDIRWFKDNFHRQIEEAVEGTPFDVDMLTALACQETGSLWQVMRHEDLTPDEVATLCCGDTLDADKGRKAFPQTKDDLIAHPRGQEMFDIARSALLAMAEHVPGYGFANKNKNKFCHGFGVFQRDLQFFKVDPDYFLEQKYEKFENTLGHALAELKKGLKKRGLEGLRKISDYEFATVAIVYNTGGFKPGKGLRQGHQSGGKYYGELVYDYLLLARTVPLPDGTAALPEPAPGSAIVPPPSDLEAAGPRFRVDTMISSLRLRSEPAIGEPATKNVIVELPDGTEVRSFTGEAVDGFIEVEARLGGGTFRGFASAKYLVKEGAGAPASEPQPPSAPSPRFPAVEMPRKSGTVTRRTDIAGAHSLNEGGMPGRTAADAEGLRQELHKIIAYLSPETDSHERYKPRKGLTFCNIYAHDYCMLAGVYLPRVWWTPPALISLSQGTAVKPLYGDTIAEMRANDMFRWLRDHGQDHGWRQASSADEAQLHANQGGVALVVARRKEDGLSGHVAMIVPETESQAARRDKAGAVTAPLQSQAGATNFNYGTSISGWWKAEKFAESAFWLHP